MNKNNRENFIFALIGHNRTGKTTISIEIIKQWKQTHKGVVIAYDTQKRVPENLKDIDITGIEPNEVLDVVMNNPESLLVLDDYRMLYSYDKTDKDLMKLLMLRNEYCIDIIISAHAPSLILERLSYYVTHYYLFYTQGTDKGFKDKMNNGIVLAMIREIINGYVKQYGKGQYETKSFPHIIFNTETETISFENMENLNLESINLN